MAPFIPAWAFMWVMAFALYGGCKWLTYRQAPIASDARSRALGYLAAWPGMDAMAFFSGSSRVSRPSASEWIAAVSKTIFGVVLTWVVARTAWPAHPLLTGWIGMVGTTFILHFGSFHLLSLCWRQAGVDALPVMRNPLRSTSLAEFWGRRWNTAFHELASRFTFRPLRRIAGASAASLLTFVVSGLIHELVISVPARAAYGLPTGYFVLQGLGVASERTPWGRRLGLGEGWRGWAFTVVVVAGPAFLLFPPPFVHRVILPMLDVIGAV
jgi:Membrane bound O-acyl transferase family